MTTPADVVNSFPPHHHPVFVILFVLLLPSLRSIIDIYNYNGLPNLEVAAHNVPTSIDQGTYLGQIPELNRTTTKENRGTGKVGQ